MPVIKSQPEILHAIVGTAGHVDHGKTSLVRLLTGCETDRLPEEKARGMSIDLGFAPCTLYGKRLVGIVDVPGHKDFIRNMVAGATSIDVLLLVVAADDGVMPQTQEHMSIVKLLRTPQMMVALTKIDMVSPEMVELARQDVAAFLSRAGYPDAPIIPVSNKTGEGIGEIQETIDRLVEQVRARREDLRAFRMNIERAFSVKGHGTVVAGIPVSGKVAVGQKVEIQPHAAELTVRGIQTYKRDSETASAACCSAINVRDIDAEAVTRGMTLASPGIYRNTTEAIVAFENVSEDVVLKRRMEIRLHSGTGVVEASLKLIASETLEPGESGFAHVLLAEPLVLAAGDRFVIRQPSPGMTLGGGTVLSARPQTLRRHTEVRERLELAQTAAMRGDYLLSELLAGPDAIVEAPEVRRLTQCLGEEADAVISAAVSGGHLLDLAGSAYAVAARASEPLAVITSQLTRYHRENPYTWGMSPNHVCEALGLPAKAFASVAAMLTRQGSVVLRHGFLALASFKPPVSERLLALRDQILQQVQSAGVNGPARGDVMRQLNIVEADMRVLTKLLIQDGTILMLDGNFILRSVYNECRETLLGLFQKQAVVDLPAFRDAIGGNRKLVVAMLDAFDGEGLTRRVADGRVLLPRAQAAVNEKEAS